MLLSANELSKMTLPCLRRSARLQWPFARHCSVGVSDFNGIGFVLGPWWLAMLCKQEQEPINFQVQPPTAANAVTPSGGFSKDAQSIVNSFQARYILHCCNWIDMALACKPWTHDKEYRKWHSSWLRSGLVTHEGQPGMRSRLQFQQTCRDWIVDDIDEGWSKWLS